LSTFLLKEPVMANQLSMAEVSAIETLRKTGKSRREIARLLGLHRETVGKYVAALEQRIVEAAGQNRPNAPPGSMANGAEQAVQNQPDHSAGGAPPTGSEHVLAGTESALTGVES
jgi:transposase